MSDPIYIKSSNHLSNPIIESQFMEDRSNDPACGMASYWKPVVNKKPVNQFYYYHIYFDNKVVQSLDFFKSGTRKEKLYIPEEVYQDALNGHCKILLDYSLEGMDSNNFSKENFTEFLGKYKQHCILLTGDYLCGTNEILDTCFTNYWERNSIDKIKHWTSIYDECDFFNERLNTDRNRKFKGICKNRVMRDQRPVLCYLIRQYNLDNFINYSMGMVTEHGPHDKLNFTFKHFTKLMHNISISWGFDIDSFTHDIISNGEQKLFFDKQDLNVNLATTGVTKSLLNDHLDSYFEIIVETNYRQNTIFHSEKTFKAIYWLQPFVSVAEQHSIKTLREMGYDVFDDYIDHSYDNIADYKERMFAVMSEIKRLCKLSEDEWKDIYKKIGSRLIKNQEKVLLGHNRYPDYFNR